jgi:myo-inositol catabolism protein IolH
VDRSGRAGGFDGTLTACVFAWEERAKESSVLMRRKIDDHLAASAMARSPKLNS